jgi:hypothetical protein
MTKQQVERLFSKFNLKLEDFEQIYSSSFESKTESFYKDADVFQFIVIKLEESISIPENRLLEENLKLSHRVKELELELEKARKPVISINPLSQIFNDLSHS